MPVASTEGFASEFLSRRIAEFQPTHRGLRCVLPVDLPVVFYNLLGLTASHR